ncbi:hypothetical protein [Massilibacteroides vaginae]|uniref:hypothetical protein n=1 Tax=Massilibacteroides vaginae TaxID=1673718 RepID=UPI000A1CC558|nr:hypothetical protein [Massilibacteroides vaginae]
MKTKILSLFIVFFSIGVFSSCEGPMGPAGVGEWDIFNLTVKGDHWAWDEDREVFYYFFDEPALTKFIAEEGSVQVAIVFDKSFHPLPFIRNLYDYDADNYVTETVSFEYGAGWIRFNFSASDLFDNLPNNYKPGTHEFKITLLH